MSLCPTIFVSKGDFRAVIDESGDVKVLVSENPSSEKRYREGDKVLLCNEVDHSMIIGVIIKHVIKSGTPKGYYIVVSKHNEDSDINTENSKKCNSQKSDSGSIIVNTIGFILALLVFIFVFGFDEKIKDEINSSTSSSVAIDFDGENLSIDTDYEYRRIRNNLFDNREDLVLNIDYNDHELEFDLDWPDETKSCDEFILNHIRSIKMIKTDSKDENTIVVDFDSILKRKIPKPDLIGCASDIVKISIKEADREKSIIDSYK